MDRTEFLEIEHKYLVPEDWDIEAFENRLKLMKCQRQSRVQVADRYFVVKACPGHIYRHRYDHELQQLTVKSLTGDPEVRLEVNLNLGHQCGNQEAAVEAFLAPLGILWSATLNKDVRAFYFQDCEVVYYRACYENQVVHCVEIEACEPASVSIGKDILKRYALALDLQSSLRSQHSLFELLLLPHIPIGLVSKFLD